MTEKEQFLQKFNEAFVNNDTSFIIHNLTDDVSWTMVGEPTIKGKEAFIEFMGKMDPPTDMTLDIKNIFHHNNWATVEGSMRMNNKIGEEKKYAFCDVYKFDTENEKIKGLTSYVIEMKPQNEENKGDN